MKSFSAALQELQKIFKEEKFTTDEHEWLEDLFTELKDNNFSYKIFENWKKVIGTKKFEKIGEKIQRNPFLISAFSEKDVPAIQVKIKKVQRLTIIVIGMTGAGKSTLINLFYIWSIGIMNLKDVKKVLIPTKYFKGIAENNSEMLVTDQTKSQTQKCSVYSFSLVFGEIQYELNFMDTPGLGDVEGIKKDDEHIENILDTISKTPELNSIVLMLNGSEARIHDRIQYVVTKLKGILPNVVQENLIILLSNVKYEPQLDVNVLLKEKISPNRIFYYENAIFQMDIQNKPEATIKNLNLDFKSIKEKLSVFMEESSLMKIQNSESFLDLKHKRDEFKNLITNIQNKIKENIQLKAQVENALLELNDYKDKGNKLNLSKMKPFTQIVDRQKETNYHNTICETCSSNCHENCGLSETTAKGSDVFKGCAAMSGDYCNHCKHHYSSHVHLRKLWVKESETTDVIDPAIAKLISENSNAKAQKELMIKGFNKKLEQIDQNINDFRKNLEETTKKVKELCSDFNYEKELELSFEILKSKKETVQEKEKESLNQLIQMFKHMLNYIFKKNIV